MLNNDGVFKLISATIEQGFTHINKRERVDGGVEPIERLWERRQIFKDFLRSPVVHAWCDCSDNFIQNKLLKYYDKYYNENALWKGKIN